MQHPLPSASFVGSVVLLAAGAFALPARADIEVNITHAGFPGINPAGELFRYGTWVPIVVDLALVGQPAFDGFVRTAQTDSDGDSYADSVEVHLRAESGGTQRLYLYAQAEPDDSDGGLAVELRTPEGDLVQVISNGVLTFRAVPASPMVPVSHDDYLILSVSSATAGRVADLADNAIQYDRMLTVAHISPTDLPDLAIGLDLVDFIVWDDAQPGQLSQKQTLALIGWVRRGGTLVIGAGASAASLKLVDEINAILPAEIGDLTSVDNLPEVRNAVLDRPRTDLEGAARGTGAPAASELDWLKTPFPQAVSVIRCKARPDATVVAREDSIQADVLTRRREGRGNIIFSSLTLRDLFSAPCSVELFFQKAFCLVRLTGDERPVPESLYDQVVSAVGFSASGTLYLLIAAIFSFCYVAGATFGLWTYLGARGWRKHSWTAFALIGGIASFVSVAAVGAVRGIGDRLHQVSVVDLESGSREGIGTAYFGLKTGVDKRVDVWLPDDWVAAREPTSGHSSLRPLPSSPDPSDVRTRFADPSEYRTAPSVAIIDDVRARATLKRFEGQWAGPLRGALEGRIWISSRKIVGESYLSNELGFDLHDCVLLIPELDPDKTPETRHGAVQVVELGRLPVGKLNLADWLLSVDETRVRRLFDLQAQWGRRGLGATGLAGGGLGPERNALLLLSILGDFSTQNHPAGFTGIYGQRTWSRERMRHMDLRSHLWAGELPREDQPGREGVAVLIGFADDPGPMRLFTRTGDRDFTVLEPEPQNSWSMYRVRVPLVRVAAQE